MEEPADPKVTGITVSPDTLDLTVGDTETLSPEVTADEGADTTVTWETSSRNVATVDNGKVTAVGPGTATITAKAGDQEATCEVKVSAQEMPAASITVAPTKLSLIVGESNTLAAATVPEGQAVSWTSSDDKIAPLPSPLPLRSMGRKNPPPARSPSRKRRVPPPSIRPLSPYL